MTLSLQQIDQGIDILLENASQLIREATVLLAVPAYARAFSLAHFAREEMSKVTMLHAAAVRLLAQQKVDWKRLMVRLRDHRAKLRLEMSETFLFLQGIPITKEVSASLRPYINSVAEHRNQDKNDSLYVGFQNGKFVLPSSAISEYKARRTVQLGKMRLEQMQSLSVISQ